MKILVTGNLGYIGSVLTSVLENKYDIIGLDSGFFKNCLLEEVIPLKKQIYKDIRDVTKSDLNGINSIIHLAALSNDPLGEFNPGLTNEINHLAAINLIKLAKSSGVKRFVYVSSQSMYGISNIKKELDEDNSEKNPVTEYAKTKWEAETFMKKLSDENFCVVCLRPSTVFGVSPRLRCDIVFNNLVACGFTTKKIEIKSDGSPWRPVVHVRDVAEAIIVSLIAPADIVSAQSYNVGVKNGNYTIKNLADAAQLAMPDCKITYTKEHLDDPRSYRVSFDKIFSHLGKYYKPSWNLESGAKELLTFFKKINFTEKDFRGPKTNRIISIKEQIDKKIDKNLRFINAS